MKKVFWYPVTILLTVFTLNFSAAQNSRMKNASNPIQIKSYSSSAGTFTAEYNSETQRTAMPHKIDFTEETFKTSDGGTATFIFNREAMEGEITKPPAAEATIQPNPFSQAATVNIENAEIDFDNAYFIVSDVLGREIRKTKITDYRFSLAKGNLPEGMFFYMIIENSILAASGKFIITRQ